VIRCVERMEQLKYLGRTLMTQNSFHEEMKSRSRFMQNLMSSSFLFKNIKVEICRTVIFPVVLYGCET
jgi:hypothetical protein